jgi:hypothetical protein
MKNLLSNLCWKIGRKFISWSVKLEPLGTPEQQITYGEIYNYTVSYRLQDGRIIPNNGPITVEEKN